MKKLLLVLLLPILVSCFSTKQIVLENPGTFEHSFEIESDKNTNFVRANEWMVDSFVSAKSVIQFSDKEAGVIKGKYLIFKGIEATGYTLGTPEKYVTITLRVRDGAAKIEIRPIGEFQARKMYGTVVGYTPDHFKKDAVSLSLDFQQKMSNKSSNDNW